MQPQELCNLFDDLALADRFGCQESDIQNAPSQGSEGEPTLFEDVKAVLGSAAVSSKQHENETGVAVVAEVEDPCLYSDNPDRLATFGAHQIYANTLIENSNTDVFVVSFLAKWCGSRHKGRLFFDTTPPIVRPKCFLPNVSVNFAVLHNFDLCRKSGKLFPKVPTFGFYGWGDGDFTLKQTLRERDSNFMNAVPNFALQHEKYRNSSDGATQNSHDVAEQSMRYNLDGAEHEFDVVEVQSFPDGKEGSKAAEFNPETLAAKSDCKVIDASHPAMNESTSKDRRGEFYLTVENSLPSCYAVDPVDGVIHHLSDRREPVPICAALLVVRLERGLDGADSFMVVAHLTEKGEVAETRIPAADIGRSSPAGVQILRNKGVRVFVRDGAFADLLRKFPYEVVEPSKVKLGWMQDPARAFGFSANTYAVAEKDSAGLAIAAERYAPDPDKIEKWKTEVGAKLIGNDFAMFLLCTALSGPILDLIGWRGGIFNFAFPTSAAKTTALMIGNNAWRKDAPHGWALTRPASDDACIAADGTFLAMDEVPEQALRQVESTVFAVCNGVRRGARAAPGQQIEDRGWNTAGASTSEFPIWELAQSDAEKGKVFGRAARAKLRIKEGTFVRLVDVGGREETVWCNLHGHPSKGDFLRSLERSSSTLAGVIGPAFVDRLLNNHDLLNKDLYAWHLKWMNRLAVELGIDPHEDDGAHMRVMGHFAAVWLAGDRAASMDILPYSRDDVAKAVRTAAHSWARIRKIGIYAVEENPVAILRSFVLPRVGKDLREVGPDRKPLSKLQYAPAGWFDEQFYFLRSSTIRDLVRSKSKSDKDLKGLVHAFCHALEEKGALVRGGAKDCMMVRMADSIECGCRVYMLRREVIDDMVEDW